MTVSDVWERKGHVDDERDIEGEDADEFVRKEIRVSLGVGEYGEKKGRESGVRALWVEGASAADVDTPARVEEEDELMFELEEAAVLVESKSEEAVDLKVGEELDDWQDFDDEDIAGLMIVAQPFYENVNHSVQSGSHEPLPPSSTVKPDSRLAPRPFHNLPPRKHSTMPYDRRDKNSEVTEIINEGLYLYQLDLKRSALKRESGAVSSLSSSLDYSPRSSLPTRESNEKVQVVAHNPYQDTAAVTGHVSSVPTNTSASAAKPVKMPVQTGGTRHFWDSTSAASPPVGWLMSRGEPQTPPFGATMARSPMLTGAPRVDVPSRQRHHATGHGHSSSHYQYARGDRRSS
ncbi:hypothetical protein HDU99_005659, partial [Rhizoclosmatium hyalinum]